MKSRIAASALVLATLGATISHPARADFFDEARGYLDMLRACSAHNFVYQHPYTGGTGSAEILGVDNGTCVVVFGTVGGDRVRCRLGEVTVSDMTSNTIYAALENGNIDALRLMPNEQTMKQECS